jgi:hypothetical protein
MRKIFTAALLLVLLAPIASAQAGKSNTTSREAKRARVIQNFRASSLGAQATAASRGTLRVAGDFDHDGRKDVVVAVPGEDSGLGAIHVFYGGATGLKTSNDQVIRQTDWCGGAAATAGSGFANAIAVGDFNGDGESDIAVSAPNYDFFGTDTGVVFLFYGNAGGQITPLDDCQYVEQSDTIAASDGRENGDHFGSSLAAGNFGSGAQSDLAIGVPDEDVGAQGDAGAVGVVYGSPNGLTFPYLGGSDGAPRNTTTLPQYWDQSGLEGVPETGDSFGQAIDAGNLGRSSHADLAIGDPGEDINETDGAGAVNIVYGSAGGLTSIHDQIWTQDTEGIKGVAEEGEGFGTVLAIGNFGRGGAGDLAVGVFLEDGAKAFAVGAVNVIYGSSGGLTGTGNQLWSQDSSGIPDSGEVLDLWGFSLAAGNVGKSGEAELIVGAPLETPGNTAFDSLCPGPRGCAGQITVIYGSSGGLTSSGAKVFNQNSSGVPDVAEPGDELGFSVAAGNYGKSSFADVAVGIPFEDVGAVADAGAINVLWGATNGLTGTGASFYSQDTAGVEDSAEAGDNFGSGLG